MSQTGPPRVNQSGSSRMFHPKKPRGLFGSAHSGCPRPGHPSHTGRVHSECYKGSATRYTTTRSRPQDTNIALSVGCGVLFLSGSGHRRVRVIVGFTLSSSHCRRVHIVVGVMLLSGSCCHQVHVVVGFTLSLGCILVSRSG